LEHSNGPINLGKRVSMNAEGRRWIGACRLVALLICGLAACHHDHQPFVRLEVFEDYVAIDGVRSGLPLERVVSDLKESHKGHILLIGQPPLSAKRLEELSHVRELLYPGIGIRRVQLECQPGASAACP
jgi:hypothetical protein